MKIHNPEKLGLSKDKLKEMEAFFKKSYTDKGKLAGTQTLISRKGKIIHFHSNGFRDVENSKKLRTFMSKMGKYKF